MPMSESQSSESGPRKRYRDWETNPLSWGDLTLLTGLTLGALAYDYGSAFLYRTGRISEGVRTINRVMTIVMLAVLFLTTAFLLYRRWQQSREVMADE